MSEILAGSMHMGQGNYMYVRTRVSLHKPESVAASDL
jgi:hypothetical protein